MPKQARAPKPPLKEHFSVGDASKLSGVTVTMIDYVEKLECLMPTGPKTRCKGVEREYSFADVVMLRALRRMLDAGLSVKKLKSALAELNVRRTLTPDALPADLLLTDGIELYFKRTEDVLEQITNRQLTFAFVIEMSRVRRDVMKQLDIKRVDGKYQYRVKESA